MLDLVDTHCHLDLRHFDSDREATIERAAAVGVGLIVNPAIDLASCRRVLALADRYPNIYAAVGVHPNDCAGLDDSTIAALRELAQHPKVVAIGEIGLDYYWEKVAHDQQKAALRAQLALAAELNLPVILHSRSARGDESRRCNADLLQEVMIIASAAQQSHPHDPSLRAVYAKQSLAHGRDCFDPHNGPRNDDGAAVGGQRSAVGVWHAFSGDLTDAHAAYDLGLVLGLGGPVTFQNARRFHALIPQLRLDRLLLETDAPYLAPHPYRGQRNEPAYVPLIAQGLARLFGVTPEVVANQTTATASRVFGRGVRYGQDG